MTTWTAKRIVLVIVGVVIGAFVLAKGFPGNPSRAVAIKRSPKPPASPSPGVSPTGPAVLPSPSATPNVRGVVVLVLNGTSRTGLASSVSQSLSNVGYKLKLPGNGPATGTTTVYYRADSRAQAEYLQQRFFPSAQLKPAPSSVAADVQVEVVLGADFTGLPSPSPSA